jgi:hypothetical protein
MATVLKHEEGGSHTCTGQHFLTRQAEYELKGGATPIMITWCMNEYQQTTFGCQIA